MLEWGGSDNGRQDEKSSEAIQWFITIIEEWTRLVYPLFALYNFVESFGGLHQERITPISPPFSTNSLVAKHTCHGLRRPEYFSAPSFPNTVSEFYFRVVLVGILASLPLQDHIAIGDPDLETELASWTSRLQPTTDDLHGPCQD
jgi:hypothetical protein